jgi:hypothetical protein
MRYPSIRWHAPAGAWTSAAGEFDKSGDRKPVYFRSIPFGPPGSPGHEAAKAALMSYLESRGGPLPAAPRGQGHRVRKSRSKGIHNRPLTDEQRRLASDPEAMEAVLQVGRSFTRRSAPRLKADILSAAMLGLVFAARKHGPDYSIPFVAYAAWRARLEIRSFLRAEPASPASLDEDRGDGSRLADVVTADHRPWA